MSDENNKNGKTDKPVVKEQASEKPWEKAASHLPVSESVDGTGDNGDGGPVSAGSILTKDSDNSKDPTEGTDQGASEEAPTPESEELEKVEALEKVESGAEKVLAVEATPGSFMRAFCELLRIQKNRRTFGNNKGPVDLETFITRFCKANDLEDCEADWRNKFDMPKRSWRDA